MFSKREEKSSASAIFSSRHSNIQYGRQADVDINAIQGILQREDSQETSLLIQGLEYPQVPEIIGRL